LRDVKFSAKKELKQKKIKLYKRYSANISTAL